MAAQALARRVADPDDVRRGHHKKAQPNELQSAVHRRSDLPDWHEVEERLLRVTERLLARG